MPVDLAALPHPPMTHVATTAALAPRHERVVIVRPQGRAVTARRSARDTLLEAELRGAPDHELRLLEEAAIAANIAGVRAMLRTGGTLTSAQRAQFERDCELLRRFPENRRGVAGGGWFHLH